MNADMSRNVMERMQSAIPSKAIVKVQQQHKAQTYGQVHGQLGGVVVKALDL